MKLALGTAQFGMDYGIANTMGRVDLDDAKRIVSLARNHGLDTLDTAIAYGECESVLGRIGVDDWKLVTKLPAIPKSCNDVLGWIHEQVEASLKRMGASQLYAVLLHRPAQLFSCYGDNLFRGLQDLVSVGLVQKVGISIYDPAELDQLFANWQFDLVQAPMNVFDRRLLESGWAGRLKDQGVELHTRSAFLQGLLLMRTDLRPAWFGRWNTLWTSWEKWLNESRLSPIEACLRFVLSVSDVDRVIVGVDSTAQLQEILKFTAGLSPDFSAAPHSDDPILLNPAHWSVS